MERKDFSDRISDTLEVFQYSIGKLHPPQVRHLEEKTTRDLSEAIR